MTDSPVRIGPFEILSRLGQGGTGDVYEGRHVDQGLRVAIKVLTSKKAWHPTYLAAFRREVRAVASLDHPHIVTVFDYGEVGAEAEERSEGALVTGSPYLVLELADRGTVSDHRGRLPWETLKEVLLDLLDALAHAHARGVVHRDLKPGNVLLGEGGIKLTDFGLAHIMGPETESGQPRGGTPAYMAPEQFEGNIRLFGPWTDLYALGCLAWTLVTGRPPFPGRKWMKVMHAQVTKNPPPLRPRVGVPRGFDHWLRQLLRKEPQRRFRWAADAAYALRQLPEEVEAVPGAPPLPQDTRIDEISTLLAPGDGPTTTLLPTESGGGKTVSIPQIPLLLEPPVRRAPPPLPETRQPSGTPFPRSAGVMGAGLGLFGLRQLPIVGRDRERDLLWERLREVFTTREPRVVALLGPTGCGKTRLAQWLVESAHEAGAATVLHAVHGATPGPSDGLGPMIGRHFRATGLPREELEVFLRKRLEAQGVRDPFEARALTELISPTARSPVRFASPTERFALVLRALGRIGEERPVIVWADDVQWSHDTLTFANFVLKAQPVEPVLLVLGVRDTALAERPAEKARLQMLLNRPATTRITVPPLSEEHASRLIRELLHLQDELADKVLARVGGNPLFATQVVGDWVQRGVLVASERGFRLKDGVEVALPDDLFEVSNAAVERVLERLPDGAQLSLLAASGLGNEVDDQEWTEVCALLEVPLPATLAEPLVEARLLRSFDGGWSFEHAMLRETLMRTARTQGTWQSVHQAIVQVLQTLYTSPPVGHTARLGKHLLEAGEYEQALLPLLEGARIFAARSQYRAARELLDLRDHAIGHLTLSPNDRSRVEGWLLRARLYAEQGRPRDAEEWASRAEAAVRSDGLEDLLGKALQRRAMALARQGELDEAERYYLAARSWYAREGEQGGLGDCLVGLGQIHEQRGRHDRAREVLVLARAAYQQVGDPLKEANCLESMARSDRHSGDLDSCEALVREALPIFEGIGARSGLAACRLQLAFVHHGRGEWTLAREECERAMALYAAIGDPAGQLACYNGFAEIARFEGDLEAAEAGYRKALELAESYGIGTSVYPRVNLGLVLLRQQRYQEARSLLEQEVEVLVERGMHGLAGGAHVAVMTAAAALGDLDGFEIHFRRGRSLLEMTGLADRDVAWPAEQTAELMAREGHEDWSRACWELALAQYERMGLLEDERRIREILSGPPEG